MTDARDSQVHGGLGRAAMWIGAALFLASIALMGRRIGEARRESPAAFFLFQGVGDRRFTFAGRDVTIQDVNKGSIDTPVPHVRILYGEATLDLRVTIPSPHRFPDLKGHEDWMRVLRFVDATGIPESSVPGKIATRERPDRLVIVTRTPRAGVDPSTWGEVWRHAWTFEFHEFMPDGTFDHQRLAYPMSKMKRERLGITDPPESELREGTWQYQAALHLMPKSGPTYQFSRSPMRDAGWTLPAAAASGVLMLAGLVGWLGARVRSRRSGAGLSPSPGSTP